MILVTGGTGFIGKSLIRNLVETGYSVRTLIRPSSRSPNLPRGIPVEVAVSSLSDERGLRAAMVGVDTVYHLASVERQGTYADLFAVDIKGARMVSKVAAEANVDRLFFVSHLGADRASAYPVLKTKGIAEEFIRKSNLDFTIFRTAIVYGPGDSFTTGLASILHALPFVFLSPGDGNTLLQPLWVEDLVTCLVWALEDNDTRNELYEIGGPEYFKFNQVLGMVMEKVGVNRRVIQTRSPYLRGATVVLETIFPSSPVSVYWLDYLAANRTCALDTIAREFQLIPARMSGRLAYLSGQDWRWSFVKSLFRRH